MYIKKKILVDNCLDGDSTYRYFFNRKWEKDAILALETLGQLAYYAKFNQPYFKLLADDFELKGIEGEDFCLVTYSKTNKQNNINQFEMHFSKKKKR